MNIAELRQRLWDSRFRELEAIADELKAAQAADPDASPGIVAFLESEARRIYLEARAFAIEQSRQTADWFRVHLLEARREVLERFEQWLENDPRATPEEQQQLTAALQSERSAIIAELAVLGAEQSPPVNLQNLYFGKRVNEG